MAKKKSATPKADEPVDLRTVANQILSGGYNHEVVALAEDWLKRTPELQPLPDTLTMRQREITEFIQTRHRSRLSSPTVREIGTEFGIRSPNGVMCHLKALVKKGIITQEPHLSRSVRLVDCYQ